MIEKIFYNGNILTQDKKNPIATAFAIADGKIVAVGNDEEILAFQTSNPILETLNQKTILPGFNDAHIHIWKVGNLMTYLLDLRGTRSIEEMQQRIVDYARQNPEVAWIQAWGFNEALFPDQRMPTKLDLDAIITDRPVCIMRTCAHQIIVNSKALELCGINRNTPEPPGGEIKKFPDGNLKGHFTETALGLILNKIPPYTPEEYRAMIFAAQYEFLKMGITAAADPAVMPDLLEVYKSMDRNGELKVRVNAMPIRVPDGAVQALPVPEHYASDFLHVDTVKFFSDGGMSGKTAALKHPYKNSAEYGVIRFQKDFFKELALESQEEGFRIATHAIGDAALDMVLDVYEEIASRNKNHIHHRIEHLGLPSERNLNQMAAMKVSAVMQPIFIYELGKNFRTYLNEEYLAYLYPCKSVLAHSINLALSTDAPVVKDFNPWIGIQSAINRRDHDGFTIAGSQKISSEEAIYAYTMGSAIANGDEKILGSMEAGKRADFIVLNENPLIDHHKTVSSIQVIETYVAGERVYSLLENTA